MTKSKTKIQYLDVEIHKVQNRLITKLFKKQTDSNNMLRGDSFHLVHSEGFPKGQFVRARRICTEDQDYKHSKEMLTKKFTERGHNKRQIQTIGKEIGQMSRQQIRQKIEKKKKKRSC